MNLITDSWIPVHRQAGEGHISPSEIVDTKNPFMSLAGCRPDFNGALLQFLIGLVQTACPPENHDQWAVWLEHPPTPEELSNLLTPFVPAFELDGDGPQFMQDLNKLTADVKSVAALLMDSPGAQTIKHNADHFVKRGGVDSMCVSCVATALFTLQTNAPSGGAGHRTSLRGGGPLSTLVALDPEGSGLRDDLWRAVWLNIIDKEALSILPGYKEDAAHESIFPWLAKTRTSEKSSGCETTPLDVHPLQMYWGMPRRIKVDWDSSTQGECNLCGITSDKLIRNYTTQNYGTNYTGAWQHPLSPHKINKDNVLLPQHAQPGGISYKHWLGLVAAKESEIPALVVKVFTSVTQPRILEGEQLRLHTFGYDMDNMKARCWYEARFPLFSLEEGERELFTARTHALIDAASNTANMVRNCIKDAWFRRPGDARGDTAFLVEAFFAHTESQFFTQIEALREQIRAKSDTQTALQSWHKLLCHSALDLFSYWAERGDFTAEDPRRIAEAHRRLKNWLYSKKGGLPKLLGIANDEEKAA